MSGHAVRGDAGWRGGAALTVPFFALPLALACQTAPPAGDASRALAPLGDPHVDAIAQRCARVASCAHRHDTPLFRDPAACVAYWLEHERDPVEPVPACLSSALSCHDIEVCLHGAGDERAAVYCVAHPDATTACDGDTLVTCARDDILESSSTTCASLGATCGETRSAGGLVARGCLSPGACSPDVTAARCDGSGAVLACHDQVLERIPCPAGAVCRAHRDEDGEELATCEAPAEVACDAIGARSCRGSVLVRCEAHGHHGRQASVDCAALGLGCGVVGGQAACTAGETPCPSSAPRCDGDDLVFCAAGRTERVSCAGLGLGPCEPEGKGPTAVCGRPERRVR